MAQISSPSEIIALLKDIERRSQQQAAGLSQQDDLHSAWTAIGFRVGEHHFLIPLSDSREVFPVPESCRLRCIGLRYRSHYKKGCRLPGSLRGQEFVVTVPRSLFSSSVHRQGSQMYARLLRVSVHSQSVLSLLES